MPRRSEWESADICPELQPPARRHDPAFGQAEFGTLKLPLLRRRCANKSDFTRADGRAKAGGLHRLRTENVGVGAGDGPSSTADKSPRAKSRPPIFERGHLSSSRSHVFRKRMRGCDTSEGLPM